MTMPSYTRTDVRLGVTITMLEHLPDMLERVMGQKELTYREAAARIGVSPSLLWKVVNDPEYSPSVRTALRMMKWLRRTWLRAESPPSD